MKLLYEIIQHLKPGGIEKLVVDIMKYKQTGVKVFIVVLEGNDCDYKLTWPELHDFDDSLIFINKKPGFDVMAIKKIRKIISNPAQNIAIHTHHLGPLVYGGLASMGLRSVNHVHTEHDAWHLQDKKQLLFTKLILKLKHVRVVADAKIVKFELATVLGRKLEIVVIENGVDTDKFANTEVEHRALKSPKEIVVYGCAARLVKEKSIDVLIKAFSALPMEVLEKSKLIIAGEGPEKKALEKLVNELNIQSFVSFVGYLKEISSFYQRIDVFTLSSTFEGLPLSILEAQSCNTPVVASNVGAVSEAVCDKTGLIVKDNTINAWREALLTIRTLPNNVCTPRQFILERFQLSHMVSKYNELLWSVK